MDIGFSSCTWAQRESQREKEIIGAEMKEPSEELITWEGPKIILPDGTIAVPFQYLHLWETQAWNAALEAVREKLPDLMETLPDHSADVVRIKNLYIVLKELRK